MSSELEIRPPSAVRTGTLQKTEREGDGLLGLLLSLSKYVQARINENQTTTGAASKNASLKIAPSGSKIGVHLIEANDFQTLLMVFAVEFV